MFLEMLKNLRKGKASGVIIHKIDRSARNLKDWADLGTLIDEGVKVHFANESIDLSSRGGRLSADIQAVVASDYIRNLREETKKGIYGRLKQGLYPFPAPVGYLNDGKGKPKKIDPVKASLIRNAFELYSTGNWGLIALADKMNRLGLRNKTGKKLSLNGIASILHNPFYIGVIRIKKTNELFAGKHPPIISKQLFDEVQVVFEGKNIKKKNRHFFVFRRHIICSGCQNSFIAERQKSYVYYRCHTPDCRKSTLREEVIENGFIQSLKKIKFNDCEEKLFRNEFIKLDEDYAKEKQSVKKQLQLNIKQTNTRLSRLADAYMDGVFDKKTYLDKKNEIILEEQSIKEKLANINQNSGDVITDLEAFLELANSAYLSYKYAKPLERRDLVKSISSNFFIKGENVLVKLNYPFELVANRPAFTSGSPCREATRTFTALLAKKLYQYFKYPDTSKNDAEFLDCIKNKKKRISLIKFLRQDRIIRL